MLPSPVCRCSAVRGPLLFSVVLIAALSGLPERAGELRASRMPAVSIRPQSTLPGLIAFPLVVMPLVWEFMQRD